MVELTDQEARWAAFAFEVQLQHHARNGRGLAADDPRREFAAKLARAAPIAAATYCPALLRTVGPEVAAEVRVLAAALDVTSQASVTSQPPRLEPGSPLTTAQVADMTGRTTHGVRAACRRGRLEASRDRVTGEWRISRRAVDEWARSAA